MSKASETTPILNNNNGDSGNSSNSSAPPPQSAANASSTCTRGELSNCKLAIIGSQFSAVILTLTVGGYSLYHHFLPQTDFATPAESLVYAARLLSLSGLILLATISNVGFYRLMNASHRDPISATYQADRNMVLRSQILQNTLEQFVLHAAALLSLSTIVADSRFLVLLTASFIVGRISFAVGYSIDSAYRVFGFALTKFPSLIALVCVSTSFICSHN